MTDIRTLLRKLPSLAGPLWPFPTQNAPETPQALFADWLRFAIEAGLREPHAMTLSTVDEHGFPDARTLILKDLDACWYFASDAAGPKGQQIARQPRVALTFYWPRLGRQVRVRGIAKAARPEQSARDFRARSTSARTVALMGRQSQDLSATDQLDAAYTDAARRLEQSPGLAPDSWTLCAVEPVEVEFWQGDVSRRHVRLLYRREADSWVRTRLWP